MKKIICLFIVLIVAVWGFWFAKCEVLTLMYSAEFKNGYELTGMLPEPDFIKVLSYDKAQARVYYVKKNEVGSTVDFIKKDNEWELKSWGGKAWSSDGSAESVVMPYFWHLLTMR